MSEAFDDVFIVLFKEGEREWPAGVLHSSAEEAAKFAREMQGYLADDDDGSGRDVFRYDSFRVARFVLAEILP